MPKVNVNLDSARVGQISFESPQNIHAQGGPEFPTLFITVDFGLTGFKEYTKPGFQPLTCLLCAGELCIPPQRTIARFQYESCFTSRNNAQIISTQMRFEIPLDLMTVCVLSRL